MTALVIITFNSANVDQEEFKFGDITKFENTIHVDSDGDGEKDRYDYKIEDSQGFLKYLKTLKEKLCIDGETAEGA